MSNYNYILRPEYLKLPTKRRCSRGAKGQLIREVEILLGDLGDEGYGDD